MPKMIKILACVLVLIMLTSCASENEKAANCSLFNALFRVEYTESSGFSILTPYQWGALEINGGLILMPSGSTVMDLMTGESDTSIMVFDLSQYKVEGESLADIYTEGMGAGEWLERILTEKLPSKAVTSVTKTGKDSACGLANVSGALRHYGISVTSERAVLVYMDSSAQYSSDSAAALNGAEKDLMDMAKSLKRVDLVAK